MKSKICRTALKMLGIVLAMSIIGTLLVIGGFMLPVNQENKSAGYEILTKEGYNPRAVVQAYSFIDYFTKFYPDGIDNSTDTIILYTALDESFESPVRQAMECYNTYMGKPYTRYWHGYAPFLRLLSLFFKLDELRILNLALQMLLIFVLAFSAGNRWGKGYAYLIMTAYFLTMPTAVSQCFQYTPVFYLAYLGTFIVINHSEKLRNNDRYLYLFLVLGALTCFTDLLTYPIYTWGVPMLFFILCAPDNNSYIKHLQEVVLGGISWIVGYGMFWIMKFIISSIILGENTFTSGMEEVALWTGQTDGSVDLQMRIHTLYTTWLHYGYVINALLLFAWLVFFVWSFMARKGKGSDKKYAYLLTGMGTVVWYVVINSHSTAHHFFTYRAWGVTIVAFMMIALDCYLNSEKVRIFIWSKAAIVAVVAVISLVLMMYTRDSMLIHNGIHDFDKAEVQGSIELQFTPSFGIIHGLKLGLETESEDGEYRIELSDGTKLLYTEYVSVASFDGGNFGELSVRWKLKKGHTYSLRVIPEDVQAPVYAYYTKDGLLPLSEASALTNGDILMDGQWLMGVDYWCPPQGYGLKMFFGLTWIGVLMTLIQVFGNEILILTKLKANKKLEK